MTAQDNNKTNSALATKPTADSSSEKRTTTTATTPSRSNNTKRGTSHVPCKFYKQGACQAGDDCPFSHEVISNATKPLCKFFQANDCKFGHKCALAHIYKGQPMSYDRKNKRAYQLMMREREQLNKEAAVLNGESHSDSPIDSSSRPLHKSDGFNGISQSALSLVHELHGHDQPYDEGLVQGQGQRHMPLHTAQTQALGHDACSASHLSENNRQQTRSHSVSSTTPLRYTSKEFYPRERHDVNGVNKEGSSSTGSQHPVASFFKAPASGVSRSFSNANAHNDTYGGVSTALTNTQEAFTSSNMTHTTVSMPLGGTVSQLNQHAMPFSVWNGHEDCWSKQSYLYESASSSLSTMPVTQTSGVGGDTSTSPGTLSGPSHNHSQSFSHSYHSPHFSAVGGQTQYGSWNESRALFGYPEQSSQYSQYMHQSAPFAFSSQQQQQQQQQPPLQDYNDFLSSPNLRWSQPQGFSLPSSTSQFPSLSPKTPQTPLFNRPRASTFGTAMSAPSASSGLDLWAQGPGSFSKTLSFPLSQGSSSTTAVSGLGATQKRNQHSPGISLSQLSMTALPTGTLGTSGASETLGYSSSKSEPLHSDTNRLNQVISELNHDDLLISRPSFSSSCPQYDSTWGMARPLSSMSLSTSLTTDGPSGPLSLRTGLPSLSSKDESPLTRSTTPAWSLTKETPLSAGVGHVSSKDASLVLEFCDSKGKTTGDSLTGLIPIDVDNGMIPGRNVSSLFMGTDTSSPTHSQSEHDPSSTSSFQPDSDDADDGSMIFTPEACLPDNLSDLLTDDEVHTRIERQRQLSDSLLTRKDSYQSVSSGSITDSQVTLLPGCSSTNYGLKITSEDHKPVLKPSLVSAHGLLEKTESRLFGASDSSSASSRFADLFHALNLNPILSGNKS